MAAGGVTDDARTVAEAFVEFCDGAQAAGLPEYGRRGRRVAALLIEACDALDCERSARRALQERCERLQDIVAQAAYNACGEASRER